MKTCLTCDTKATNAALQCSNCGSEFSYVSDEPDPEFEAYENGISSPVAIQPKPEASVWTKIIAICLAALVAMFGYAQYSASRLANCASQAMQTNSLGTVLDVRLNGLECEYLVRPSDFGIGIQRSAEWWPQSSFETLYMEKGGSAPNK